MGFVDFLWLLFFALFAVLALDMSIRRFGFWFTPLSVYCGVNCMSLCAYHLRLLPMEGVSLLTHLFILGSLLAFVFGVIAAGVPRVLPGRSAQEHPHDSRGLGFFFHVTAILSAIGWVVPSLILVARHGLGALLANIWVLQLEFQMQYIGYLNVLGILVLPTFALLDRRERGRPMTLLLVASAMLGLVLSGIKSYLFWSVMAAMFCWSVMATSRFRPRVVLTGALVLIGFFVVYTRYIDIFVGDFRTADGIFGQLKSLHRPYVYFVGAWPALDDLLHGLVAPREQWASITLDPIWKILGDGFRVIKPVPLALPFTSIGNCMFNVYSFMGELVFDFKWPGAVVCSWVFGFVGTRIYLRAMRPVYWGHVLVYGLFGIGIILSAFMYMYRFNLAVLLIYVYAMGFVVARRGVFVDRSGDG